MGILSPFPFVSLSFPYPLCINALIAEINHLIC